MKYLFFTILVLPIVLLLYTATSRGEDGRLGSVTCEQVRQYMPIYWNSTLEEQRTKIKSLSKEQIKFIQKCLKERK